MGNIRTHRNVGEAAKHELPDDHKQVGLEEFRTYFRMGNWLTDVSQLRDPFANALGKSTAWRKAKEEKFALKIPWVQDLVAKMDNWLDELNGEPGDSDRQALLSTWFGRAVFVYGMEVFRDRSEDRKKALAAVSNPAGVVRAVVDAATAPFPGGESDAKDIGKLIEQVMAKPSNEEHKVAPAEFKRVFDKYWTQYWPHEHVDFPPWPLGDPIGERVRSDQKQHSCDHSNGDKPDGQARRLLKYQEEQIMYLAEALTSIEQEWIELGTDYGAEESRQKLHDLLVRLGKCSHAVEDFYFHSNFVETAWTMLTDQERGTSDKDALGLGTPRAERILRRRLRAPMPEGDKLSPKRSAAAELVFTEAFGEKDISHTFADTMSDMEARSEMLRMFAKVFEPLMLVTNHERQGFLDDKKVATVTEEHFKRVQAGTYVKRADWLVDHWAIAPESRDALKEAMEIDGKLYKKYEKIGLGIFGFVFKLMSASDKDHTASEKVSDTLDAKPLAPDQEPTDNGASAENIGSHSLMAKDSIRKEPLRTLAINVSVFVVRYLIRTMMQSVGLRSREVAVARSNRDSKDANTLDRIKAVDWLHLLRHFICHPAECEQQWYKPLILNVASKDVNDELMASTPHYHVLKALDAATVKERREEKTRKVLEKRYVDIANEAESKWNAMITREFIVDCLLVAATAAVIVAAVVKLTGGSTTDALKAATGGAAGAVAGGLAGAALGGAIGGPAGAFAGAALGAVGGAVAGALLAKKL